MKKSDEIRRQIADLTDEAERIVNRAEDEQRELSPAESGRWCAIMGDRQSGTKGMLSFLDGQLQEAVMNENNISLQRGQRNIPAPQLVYDHNGAGPYTGGQPRVLPRTLKAFASESDARDCGLWLRGRVGGDSESLHTLIASRGQEWFATQTENQPAQGGYLVPTSFANAIMVSRQDTGALRKLARIVPMSTETLSYPKQTAGTTVYYPGEEGSITPSDLDFGRVNLTVKKRAIYALVSNELKDDAMPSIMDLLAQDMGQQLALKEDAESVIGDGTSTYGLVTGIRPALIAATASVQSAATGHDTWPELDYGDFGLLMSKLPAKYRVSQNLKWLCSPAFKWGVMDRLALAAGGNLAQNMVDGQPQNRFLGYEVVLSDDMPSTTAASTVCCAFGNFDRAVLLGERNEVRIATSEHIAFQTDQTAVRATVRYDINVHEAGDASTAGAIVALATAA